MKKKIPRYFTSHSRSLAGAFTDESERSADETAETCGFFFVLKKKTPTTTTTRKKKKKYLIAGAVPISTFSSIIVQL
jgi:hypothetical protein